MGERLSDKSLSLYVAVQALAPKAKYTISSRFAEADEIVEIRTRASAPLIIGDGPAEAAARYAEGSVDLLRVRGVLTIALFKAWKDRLSSRALIICDDDVTPKEFGARFRLSANGDMVAVAPGDPGVLAPLLAAEAANLGDSVRAAYVRLNPIGAPRAKRAPADAPPAKIAAVSELLAKDERAYIERSGLFDRSWYLSTYKDVAASGGDPLTHYLVSGGLEGRDPSPLFSSAWYTRQHHLGPGAHPLLHYVHEGWRQGLDPHPLFDSSYYRSRYPEARSVPALVHYLLEGAGQGYQPNAYFDGDYYLARNPDAQVSELTPLAHYVHRRQTAPVVHPLFNGEIYKLRYPDWAPSGLSALGHYVRFGRARKYLVQDPDLLLVDTKVAVAAHIASAEVLAEVAERLRAIPIPFDLYVSHPPGESALAKEIRKALPAARLEVAKDGATGFLAHGDALTDKGYHAVCKIQATQAGPLADVRRRLALDGVLGGVAQVRDILGYFSADPSLGLVGSLDFHTTSSPAGKVRAALDDLIETLYPDASREGEARFEGGVYWVQPGLLRRLRASTRALDIVRGRALSDFEREELLDRFMSSACGIEGARVGVVRNETDDRVELDVRRAPGAIATAPLAEFIELQGKRLEKQDPQFAPTARRKWKPSEGQTPGFTLVGPVRAVNGLGVSARGYVASLDALGLPLNVIPWTPGFERVKTQEFKEYRCGLQPINLIHLNLDLMTDARLLEVAPLNRIVTDDRYNIAIIYWELMSIRPEWLPTIERFDEIWVASEFMRRALIAVTKIPVHVVRPTVTLEHAPAKYGRKALGLPEGKTIFFYGADAGSTSGRKNPRAFWEAYCEEFKPSENACCVIKLHYGNSNLDSVADLIELARTRPDVMLIDKTLSAAEMGGLFNAIDCYVSPQRSEGLGLTVIEAMRAAKPVISTSYGGVADFVTRNTAFVVEHRLIEVGAGSAPYPPTYLWADPKADSLRAHMRAVFEDPAAAARVALAGQANVAELFSLDVTSSVVAAHVKRIWGSTGGDVARPVSSPKTRRVANPI